MATDKGQKDKHGVLVQTDEKLPDGYQLTAAARRAILVELMDGESVKVVAIRYDVTEQTVNRIKRDFIQANGNAFTLSNLKPDEFKTEIRRKAVRAIENGLECDRDPYRQGALGVQVMKGIGEFKEHQETNAKVAVLVGTVPLEWKQRYIGLEAEEVK